MTTLLRLAGVAVALALVAPVVGADDDQKLKLEGTYTVTAGERDGTAIAPDELTGLTVRVTADKLVLADKDGKELMTATYTLDQSQKPCRVRMKGTGSQDGKEFQGICEQTADGVKLCFCRDGGDPPTEFRTKEKQSLYVLKRQ